MQHVDDGSNPDIYQGSSIRARMATKTNGRVFLVTVDAVAGLDEQRHPSPLRNILSSFVQDADLYCLSSSLNSSLFIEIRSARSRGCVTADSYRTDVATRFEQVMHTTFFSWHHV